MQDKWMVRTALLGLVALQFHVDANWKSRNGNGKEKLPAGMYHYDDRSTFLKAEYLFWYPQQENCFSTIVSDQNGSSSSNTNVSLKQPGFGVSSGVRLGVGTFNDDGWDIGLTGMYLHGKGKNHQFSEGSSVGMVDSRTRLRLNHFAIDLSLGREFFLTQKFSIHPAIGVRGFGIYENLRSNNKITDRDNSTTSPFSFQNHLNGAGPRGGLDLTFYLDSHFSILGGFSGACLLAHYNVKQEIPESSSSTLALKHHGLFVRTNLDHYVGFGWENWYNNDKNRIHLALLCEASEWFGVNQTAQISNPSDLSDPSHAYRLSRKGGDLGYLGGTARVQIDF